MSIGLRFLFGGQRYGDILVPSGGQRYGDILVPSGGLHDQHALQRGFAVGLSKTTECLGAADQDANTESRTILSH